MTNLSNLDEASRCFTLFWFFSFSCLPHSEEDGEQEDKTIWYYSTKVNSYNRTFSYLRRLCCLVEFHLQKPVLRLSCSHSVPQVQLAELIDCLDKEFWEADLYLAIEEIRDEVHTHMDISEDLTNKARGNNKSFLAVANGTKM